MLRRPALAALVLLASGCGADAPDRDAPLVIGYIGDTTHADGWRGAQLGGLEAQRTAQLIGRTLDVFVEPAADSVSARAAAARLIDRGAAVLVGGYDESTCRTLMRFADSATVLFMNVGCRSDALRGSGGNTFHVQASDALRRAPDGAVSTARPEARVVWHGQLGRYGAAQLNRRFLEQFGTAAGDDAWAA